MFELLFKYPASLFHKGQFVFLTPWPMWIFGLAILAGAGLLFWNVRRNHGMLSGLRPLAIWGLESAMLALILFLLWHPALSVATLKPQQNVVAVLVDDSRSMSIADSSGTREAAAKSVLDNGLLRDLGQKFQVRLYKFGAEPERIAKTDQLTGVAPASRIGGTLERVLAESTSLPLGAIVLLSDGADNSGGIDLDTIAAIRRQRIPVHTIGFGREHPQKDVEITDAVVAPRALPQSRLTAVVSLQSWGLSGNHAKLSVRDSGKVLASQDITLRADGQIQSETLVFNCGEAGPKTLSIGVEPVSGEENTANNQVSRLVNVENRKPRIFYFEGEPRWEYKFIRRALDDYNGIDMAAMVRTTQNKFLRQFPTDMGEHDLEEGFPGKAEDLFRFQGLIIGSVEANYFTPTQQQLIHDFVDRRGGGVLFLGGRATLSDGGYQSAPLLSDLVPVTLPEGKATFHRDFTGEELTPEGARSVITRLDDDSARNIDKWKKMPQMANYQEVGPPKPGATVLLESTPAGRPKFPLLVTQNFGRGRSVLLASEGTWRWKMWMDHTDKTHATFWQQIFRYMVTDTPGQVTSTTPKQVLADDTRVPIRVEVRDKEYKPVTNAKVQARFMGPGGESATMELAPVPLQEGVYGGEWTAEKPGSYVAEIIAGRDQEEIGHDVLTFRREDGVAENFHTSQNRELLQKLADQTGGRYYRPDEASKLAKEISYSEAGITARETRDLWDMPVLFLLAMAIKAAEWLLRRKWGVV
ncbi:MAG TPA: glutamine amidotransferase [Bryobacteraceae bacterium]|nr:glutamine amidotransferase [Bryobacteraceae bacterium]